MSEGEKPASTSLRVTKIAFESSEDDDEVHLSPTNKTSPRSDATNEEAQLLEPDHPILERFQKALKEQLLRQINALKNEALELEQGAKKKSEQREQLGIETYEAQQLVNRQQSDLEMCVVQLQELCAATEQVEDELEKAKDSFNEKRVELLEAEKAELHLKNEVEGFNLLIEQMNRWESHIESELTINQKTYEKMKKEKMRLGGEQKKLDMIIYKLMIENWRLEEELETLDMQLRVKEEERERLAEAITTSNVDLETMNCEYRCLLHSWNSIISAIAQRDKHYNGVKQELDFLNEKVRLMESELQQTKKLCQKEMEQNQRLTELKAQIMADMENCKRLTEIETKKRNIIERQMNKNQMMLDQIENDIKRTGAINDGKSAELAAITKIFEQLCRQKVDLDGQVLEKLDQQLTNNKAARYLSKLVVQVKEKNRNLEITMAKLENSNAKVMMDIEAMKCMNDETQRFLDELIKQTESFEKEYKDRLNQLGESKNYSEKRQRDIAVLTTKINDAIIAQGGIADMTPEEIKILNLEKNIEEIREKIKELQQFWLRQQGHVVGLSHQRQDQIRDMNFIKKQMMLLIQKNLKINDELDAYQKQEDKMTRSINNLQNRLTVLNDELCKRKGYKESVSKDNDSLQNEYVSKLKEGELQILNVKSDITDIEEDKVNLSKELIELNREALVWEKKIQMTVETKKCMDAEKGAGGEMGNMKAEIHRMHVRFSQLKRAQDKLLHDLEHCISRRDAMLTLCEAREKKTKGGAERTRINFTRKLSDMRNSIKQLQNETQTMENKIEFAIKEEQRLTEEINMAIAEHAKTQEKVQEMLEDVEETKTLRQKNLETLVIKQKKLQVYSEISKGRYPFLIYKNENTIHLENNKQQELNHKLVTVVQNLLTDFPNHLHTLQRIYNTLILPVKLL